MFDFTFEPALDMLSFSKNIFISFDTLAAATTHKYFSLSVSLISGASSAGRHSSSL